MTSTASRTAVPRAATVDATLRQSHATAGAHGQRLAALVVGIRKEIR